MRSKNIIFFVFILLLLILTGCSILEKDNGSSALSVEEKYNEGVEAMDNAEWDTAIAFFSEIDYQDSKDLLEKCIIEKGMHEKSDYDFLNTMGISLINRYKMSEETDDVLKCVETELEMIVKYKEAEFYDETLQKLAIAYIEGLEIEKQSFSEPHGSRQIKYYEGHAKRFEALKSLTDNYGFLSDDVDYKVNYYNKATEEIGDYTALLEIEADLSNQMEDNMVCERIDDSYYRIQITNNTDYNYNMLMHFTFKDADGAITGTNDIYYEDIEARAKYNLDFYFPEDAVSFDWYSEEYIQH